MKEFISRLTWVDYIAFAACIRGFYVGYKAGFFPELLRSASYVLTVVAALHFHDMLAQWLTLKTFLNMTMATGIAFAAILVASFVLTLLIRKLLLKMLKVGDGGFLGRLIGLLMGACRWLMLLSLLFMLIDRLPLSQLQADVHSRSLTGPTIARVSPTLFEYLSAMPPEPTVSKKVK